MFRGRKSMLKYIQSNPDRFHPEALRKFKSVPTQNKKFSAEYDWNENDPTMPEGEFFNVDFGGHLYSLMSGWKSAIINMNSFGKIVESIRFLSPDGRFLTSRVEAIKYMLKDGSASLEDMNRMRLGLLKDGWESDPKLPQGNLIVVKIIIRLYPFSDCRVVYEA